jgi:hypothetical protein
MHLHQNLYRHLHRHLHRHPRTRTLGAAAAIWLAAVATSSAADWLTAPSYFTHDTSSGERVAQYAPIGPFNYFTRPDYLKSGYRQYRSTIDLGNSSDNMHVVEQWGGQVVPYEVWRFPYRPYSSPYQAWGPPYGGLGGGTGGYPYSGGLGGANIYGGLFPGGGAGYGGAGYGGAGYGGAGYGGAGFGGGFGGGFGSGGGVAPFAGAGAPALNNGARAMGAGGSQGGQPGQPGGNSGPGRGGRRGGGRHFRGNGVYPIIPQPPIQLYPPNYAQPWLDGHYPSYDLNDRSQYWQGYGLGRP